MGDELDRHVPAAFTAFAGFEQVENGGRKGCVKFIEGWGFKVEPGQVATFDKPDASVRIVGGLHNNDGHASYGAAP